MARTRGQDRRAANALIATADPGILDDLLRLAAAADAEADVAQAAGQACAVWQQPPLVLVGVDLAPELSRSRAPRRPGVVLVTPDRGDADVYRLAVEIGAQDVAVLPHAEARLIDALAASTEPAGEHAVTVCVTGGRGGAGASTLSAVLGLAAMSLGLRALLVDGDPLGGGLDLVLGQEGMPGARWPEFGNVHGRLSSAALRDVLPVLHGAGDGDFAGGELAVLSWHRGAAEPVPQPAVRSVLDAARRGFDLVVVDLPRHLGEAAVEALPTAIVTFLVVPAEVRAVVAGDRVAAALAGHNANVRVVVREPAPGGLSPEAVAGALDLPLAGTITTDRRLAAAIEHGELPTVFRRGPLTGMGTDLVTELITGMVTEGGAGSPRWRGERSR